MITYIALFSALLSRLTALACGSTWVTIFIACFLNIHWSGVLTALAWLMPHETAAVWVHVLCTSYNHAPCHFMQSHIRKMYACLAVTCHLHFWQNDPDLYYQLHYYQLIRKSCHKTQKDSIFLWFMFSMLQSSLLVIQFLLNMTWGDVFVSTRCNISTLQKLMKHEIDDKTDITQLHL